MYVCLCVGGGGEGGGHPDSLRILSVVQLKVIVLFMLLCGSKKLQQMNNIFT